MAPAGVVLTGVVVGAALSLAAVALYGRATGGPAVDPSEAHDVAVASLSAPVVATDRSGVVVHYNAAADGLFAEGASPVGDPLAEHLPDLAAELTAADGEFAVDLRTTLDGRRRHFTATATPFDGGWVVTMLDVTTRELREQRLDVLNRLLRHNLRTETSILLGHGETLADHDDPAVADAGAAVRTAARRLADVSEEARRMNALLDATTEPSRVDAAAAVGQLVAEARETYPGATVRLQRPEEVMVRCHVSVRDAVTELVENAVVHHDGRPTVEVTVEAAGDWVTVEVADDGPGIPEAELAAIQDGGETQLVHASGLGLWLVWWTTTASGGTVRFGENDPRGTVVSLELPAA